MESDLDRKRLFTYLRENSVASDIGNVDAVERCSSGGRLGATGCLHTRLDHRWLIDQSVCDWIQWIEAVVVPVRTLHCKLRQQRMFSSVVLQAVQLVNIRSSWTSVIP